MYNRIVEIITNSIDTKKDILENGIAEILECVELVKVTLHQGGKVMLCGNGGSAADAQHIATELMVRLRHTKNRPAMPAIALTTDSSLLTACANDYGYNEIFARQIEGLGQEHDILIAISTSGNSRNVIRAVEEAKKRKIKTIGFLGGRGGELEMMVDVALVVPNDDTGRIQECHIMFGHILCDLVEQMLHGETEEDNEN